VEIHPSGVSIEGNRVINDDRGAKYIDVIVSGANDKTKTVEHTRRIHPIANSNKAFLSVAHFLSAHSQTNPTVLAILELDISLVKIENILDGRGDIARVNSDRT
jgi:hypothetical protein